MKHGKYFENYKKDGIEFHRDFMELLGYSKKLNDKLHTLKIKESERSLLIAGTLIALNNRTFKDSYKKEEKINDLIENYLTKVKNELSNTNKNRNEIITTFSFIKTHAILSRDLKIFKNIIAEIDENINSFMKKYKYFDTLGQFYIEFLRYANNDKGLGIVLTPPHIAELFCRLANINENSVILDNCAGIGGFLIYSRQIIGIEYQHDIFTLLCCNMHIHGGKHSNLIKGSCFDEKVKKQIKRFRPDTGFLNPPYKKSSDDTEELDFVLNNLSFLEKGGYCIAIVPMSCALATKGNVFSLKKELLQEHTLCAVLSMPNDLFKNSKVGVNTCVMVFKAKEKHPDRYKTLFMYCKDDGFTNRKTLGRADYDKKWPTIRKKWINAFINRSSIVGFSVKKEVKACDEWCAEAYTQTDYSVLNENMFKETIMKHLSYELLNARKTDITNEAFSNDKIKLNFKNWRKFKYGDIFTIDRGKSNDDDDTQNPNPLIGASQNENGTNGEYINAEPYYKTPLITVGNGGNTGCGQSFFQSIPFNAKSTVNILDIRKKYKYKMNEFAGMFLVTVIKLEKYRFNFGRGWSKERMKDDIIKLPAKQNGEPDFEFMEKYIKSLPYSKNLE